MKIKRQICAFLLCLLALVPGGQARNVFVLPASGSSQVVNVFTGDPLAFVNSFLASSASFQAFTLPNGSKTYIFSKAGSDTVVVTDQNFTNILRRLSFGDNGNAALLTPDGRRFVLTTSGIGANAVRIIDTATDFEIPPPVSLEVGQGPNSIAVSANSRYVFVLSSLSQRLTRIDLQTNTVSGPTVTIPGVSTAVAMGPNGLLYVSAINQVIEVDPNTMTIRGNIPVNARPGELVFTADGRNAVAVNQTVITGTMLLLFDLGSRSVVGSIPALTVGSLSVVVDRIFLVSNTRAYIYSSQQQILYDVTLAPMNIFPVTFGGIGTPGGITAVNISNELPTARYLYYTSLGTLFRVDLSTNQVSGQITVPGATNAVSFSGPASTAPPAGMLLYNATQTIQPGGSFLPLFTRVLDSTGRPVINATVTFATSIAGVTIQNATATTNADGIAEAAVFPGGVLGPITVTATSGTVTNTFTLTVVSTTTPGAGGISIVTGNGQMVPENFVAAEPFKVVLRDATGTPINNVIVNWTITQGAGALLATQTLTDVNGETSSSFIATSVPPGFSYTTAVVTASAATGSVNFIVTSILLTLPGGGQAAPPLVQMLKPAFDSRRLRGQAGQVIQGAVEIAVQVVSGPQSGQPMAGIGVRAVSGVDPALFPSASCVGGTVLTDPNGLAICDIRLGPRIGMGDFVVNVGGLLVTLPIVIEVEAGPPGILTKRGGDNPVQSGNPGQLLPLAMNVEIADSFGNILRAVTGIWEVVEPGTATLRNTFSTSDINGRVSTLVTLGNRPGNVQVRFRLGTLSATFNMTVNVILGQLIKISGDGQVGQVNQAFSQPIVVLVNSTQNQPVPGFNVNFAVSSGNATLNTTRVVSDNAGRASATVTAGSTPGTIVITVSVEGLPSLTFTLTSRVPGPVITGSSFTVVPGGQLGVVPGSFFRIRGLGLAPGIQNCISTGTLVGSLPFELATVTVRFGPDSSPMFAPIYAVCAIGGVEDVIGQAPADLPPGTTSVTVRVSGGNTVVSNVLVHAVQPSLFETTLSDGQRYAILMRPDGSLVTIDNPALRGETLCVYAAGLGVTMPRFGTNQPGSANQRVQASLVIGVNNAGVRVVDAVYAPNLLGIYLVYFVVPEDTTPGTQRPFVLAAVGADGNLIFSNGTSIVIR